MQLTPHFTLAEFTKSGTAARKGIDNTPPQSFEAKLKGLAEVLETIRAEFGGRPLTINSGFRCRALNDAIGGATYSEHLMGCAADFEIIGVDNREVYLWIVNDSKIDFSQCFLEHYHDGGDPNSGWIHLAIPCPTRHTGRIG